MSFTIKNSFIRKCFITKKTPAERFSSALECIVLWKGDGDWSEDLQERIDHHKFYIFVGYIDKLEFVIALENRWFSELLPYQCQRQLVKEYINCIFTSTSQRKIHLTFRWPFIWHVSGKKQQLCILKRHWLQRYDLCHSQVAVSCSIWLLLLVLQALFWSLFLMVFMYLVKGCCVFEFC